MHRVFTQTDNTDRLDYWLHHPRSVADLEAMGAALEEGVVVILHGPAGGEVAAALHFQAEVNCWIGYPVARMG